VLALSASLVSVAQASPPAKGQYHLNAPSAGGGPSTPPGGAVSTNDGGSSSTLWIIVAAAAVAAIGTAVVYTRGRSEPPAEK
jgi:hypothetical protein